MREHRWRTFPAPCYWIMGGISHEGKSAGAGWRRADLFLLPPPGFLWYGHRIVQPVENLAHAAE